MQRVTAVPPGADRVVVVVNPRAGAGSSGRMAGRLVERLEAAGWHASLLECREQAAVEANQLHAGGQLRALVAAGGDGTAADMVNLADNGVPLSLLPLGTSNLLARYLGLTSLDAVVDAITGGTVLRLDAGSANGRVFLLMATCGFDADVVERLHASRTGHIRRWSYLKPIAATIRSYQYPPLRICFTQSGENQQGEVQRSETLHWASLFNLPCYGAGFRFTPGANGLDGLLDLCAFEAPSARKGLRFLGGVLLGRHQHMQGCIFEQVRQVSIEADADVTYQLDGDVGGRLPCQLEVLPGRLSMVVPGSCVRLPETT